MERTRSVLGEVARAGDTLTYAELRERLGVAVPHRGPRDLAALLRAASLAEERAGRAWSRLWWWERRGARGGVVPSGCRSGAGRRG